MKNNFFKSPTGAKINLYVSEPKNETRGIVHITHGLAEHAYRYRHFAKSCSSAGFITFAHDLRGHGHTESEDAPIGVFAKSNGFKLVMEDYYAVIMLIRKLNPGKPLICFGHSLGSLLALNFAIKHPDGLDGLACWNTGAEGGFLPHASQIILSVEKLFRDPIFPSLVARKLTFDAWNAKFKPNRTQFDWLSQDNEKVDAYVKDPLCGFDASISMWLDILKAVFSANRKAYLKNLPKNLPVHLLGGEDDPVTNFGRDMRKLLNKLIKVGLNDVTCKILTKTRHESINEINRDSTIELFLKWLDQRY